MEILKILLSGLLQSVAGALINLFKESPEHKAGRVEAEKNMADKSLTEIQEAKEIHEKNSVLSDADIDKRLRS